MGSLETIYLPTGDGVCAGILHVGVPADIHLQVAIKVFEGAAQPLRRITNRDQ